MFRKPINRSKLSNAAASVVETLESRQLMSVSVSGSTLNVFGTPGADSIQLSNGYQGRLSVNDNGALATFSGINQVRVYGYAGNDTIIAATSFAKPMTVFGGPGNDSIRGGLCNDSLVGEDGNDTLYGQGGNDSIRGGTGADLISGDSGNDSLWGDAGSDSLYGGFGNDNLFGGADADLLQGDDGDDTLVSIGGSAFDTLRGNAGRDSFWADFENTEIIADASSPLETLTNVHRVGAFVPYSFSTGSVSISRELAGQSLRDPVNGSNYVNFSNRPLFASAGPSKDDISQGSLGDCYFMATLSATARTNANCIRQSVVDLGDGTYAVQFTKSGSRRFVRVDGDLPTNGAGGLSYARLGSGNSIWCAVMEKAWAFYRKSDSNYKSIESGNPTEVFAALGSSADNLNINAWYRFWNEGKDLWNYINDRLSAGKAVTVSTVDQPAHLVGDHVYSVDRAYVAADGMRHIVLRNPWGGAGACIDLTGKQLIDEINGVQSAYI